MIKIIDILERSFMNEDLVVNQQYLLDQDENLFSFFWDNHRLGFKGSISKVYNDDKLMIYLRDEMGGIIKFCFV